MYSACASVDCGAFCGHGYEGAIMQPCRSVWCGRVLAALPAGTSRARGRQAAGCGGQAAGWLRAAGRAVLSA